MADDLDTDSVVCHLDTSVHLDLRTQSGRSVPYTSYVPCEHSSLTSSSLSSSSGSTPDTFDRWNCSDDDLFGDGSRNIFSNPRNDADNEDGVASLAKDIDRKLILNDSKNFRNDITSTHTKYYGIPCENSDVPEDQIETVLDSGFTKGKPCENSEITEDQVEVDLVTQSSIENPTPEKLIELFNSYSEDDENYLSSKGRPDSKRTVESKNVYKGKDFGIRKEYQNTGPPEKQLRKRQLENSHCLQPPPTTDYISGNIGHQSYTCVPPPSIAAPHNDRVSTMKEHRRDFRSLTPKDVADFTEEFSPSGKKTSFVNTNNCNVPNTHYQNQNINSQNAARSLPPFSTFQEPWMNPRDVHQEILNSYSSPLLKTSLTINNSGQTLYPSQLSKYKIPNPTQPRNMNGRQTARLQNLNDAPHTVTSNESFGQYTVPHRGPAYENLLFEQPEAPRRKAPTKSPEQNLPLIIFDVAFSPVSPSSSEGTPLSPARSFTSSDSSPLHECSSDTSSRSSVYSPASSNDALTASGLKEMSLNEGDVSSTDDDSDAESEVVTGNNELHELAFQTDEALMKRTVENLTDLSSLIHEKNRNGQTPLYFCAKHGNETAVKILLYHGSNPKILCCRKDSRKIDNSFIENALHVACEKGFTKIVQLLLNRCLDTDFVNLKRSGDAFSPFMLALTEHSLRQDRTDVIKELLKYDIDLSIIDRKTGRNALMIAIKNHALDIAEEILECLEVTEQRSQVTHTDYSGNTCLHMLAEITTSDEFPSNTRERVRSFGLILTRCGADVNARNNENMTARDYCHDLMIQIGTRR